MTDARDASQAAERVAAYVEARTHGRDASISWDDLRAVLAEHEQMRQQIDAMRTEWASKNWDNGEPYYVSFDTEKGARMSERRIPRAVAVHRLVGEWQQADEEQA